MLWSINNPQKCKSPVLGRNHIVIFSDVQYLLMVSDNFYCDIAGKSTLKATKHSFMVFEYYRVVKTVTIIIIISITVEILSE